MATTCKQLTKDEHEIRMSGLLLDKEYCKLNLDAYAIVLLLIDTRGKEVKWLTVPHAKSGCNS